MQGPDGDFGLVPGGEVVHDIDVEVLRILPGGLDLAIYERNRSTPGRSSEGLDLDLARRAGDVVGETSPVVDVLGVSPASRSSSMTYSIPARSMSALATAPRFQVVRPSCSRKSGLSAWESVPSGPVTCPDLRFGVSASDRERPFVTGVNGPLMAQRTAASPGLTGMPCSSPVLLDRCHLSGRGRRVKAREATACGLALTRRTRPRQSSSEEDSACLEAASVSD